MTNPDALHQTLAGQWRYRSFLNALPPAQQLDELLFGEGTLTWQVAPNGLITGGSLSFGPEHPMVFTGRFHGLAPGGPGLPEVGLEATALGVADTKTEGWVYQYRGWLLPTWSFATTSQVVLAGTVIRVVAHGSQSPAGVTASFLAIQYPPDYTA